MLEDHFILVEYLLTGYPFGTIKTILDNLKHQVIIGHIKDQHDHAPLPAGHLKLLVGAGQMVQNIPVQLRFAMLVKAERNVQFGHPLAGHNSPQKLDQIIRPGHHHVKIGASKAENNTAVCLVQNQLVDLETPVRI